MTFRSISLIAVVSTLALTGAGCRKDSPSNPANSDYANAINAYYSAHPACLWSDSMRMPTQQDVDKLDRTQGYDALVDMGYLQRMQATKKTFIFGSKQVSDYDLTPQGRTAWVADPRQPGYGNFCFGHRSVTNVDNVVLAPAAQQQPQTATVNYHYAIQDAAGWAKNAELQTAFPGVASMLTAPQADTATVIKTSAGWQMSAPHTSAMAPGPLGDKTKDYGVVGQH